MDSYHEARENLKDIITLIVNSLTNKNPSIKIYEESGQKFFIENFIKIYNILKDLDIETIKYFIDLIYESKFFILIIYTLSHILNNSYEKFNINEVKNYFYEKLLEDILKYNNISLLDIVTKHYSFIFETYDTDYTFSMNILGFSMRDRIYKDNKSCKKMIYNNMINVLDFMNIIYSKLSYDNKILFTINIKSTIQSINYVLKIDKDFKEKYSNILEEKIELIEDLLI